MRKFVVVCNGGLFVNGNNKNVFNYDELINSINSWSNGEPMVNEDGEQLTADELIDYGTVDIYNEWMVEMGDDFVTISIVELQE